MGAGASTILKKSDPLHFSVFLKVKAKYEEDFSPKIAAGEMTEADAHHAMITLYDETVKDVSARRKLMREKSQRMGEKFELGDVLTFTKDGKDHEGILIALHFEDDHVSVDDGTQVHELHFDDVLLKMKGDEVELGDKVEARFKDSGAIFFPGKVISIDEDNDTVDLLMAASEEEGSNEEPDIEKGVPRRSLRKVQTGRQLSILRWKKAGTAIKSMRAFIRGMKSSGEQKHPLADVIDAQVEAELVSCETSS